MDLSLESEWEKKYQDPERPGSVEWLLSWETLEPYVLRFFKQKTMEIIIPGCGSSSIPVKLTQVGFCNLTCIDFSTTLIKQMQEKHPNIDWVVMDACKMDIPSGCCDAVLDKALMDCLYTSNEAVDKVGELISEVHRVLRTGGLYIVVSHGAPGTRMPYFQASNQAWRLVETIPVPVLDNASRVYHMYVMQKVKMQLEKK